jgi:hypothetical protein
MELLSCQGNSFRSVWQLENEAFVLWPEMPAEEVEKNGDGERFTNLADNPLPDRIA